VKKSRRWPELDLEDKIGELEELKNIAYWERNQLVLALSKVFPAWLERHPEEERDWDPEWRWIVYIEIPAEARSLHPDELGPAQLSWHIHDSEQPHFNHLPVRYGNSWDGHTTNEKYDRLYSIKPAYPAEIAPIE
jgi:hypothetical protein